jgi:hypothetical protein
MYASTSQSFINMSDNNLEELSIDSEIAAKIAVYDLEWKTTDAAYKSEWKAMFYVDQQGEEGRRWHYAHQAARTSWLTRREAALRPLMEQKRIRDAELYFAQLSAMSDTDLRAEIIALLVDVKFAVAEPVPLPTVETIHI